MIEGTSEDQRARYQAFAAMPEGLLENWAHSVREHGDEITSLGLLQVAKRYQGGGALVDVDGSGVYGSRPIKRLRRSKAEMAHLRYVLYETVRDNRPVTDRQTFYLLVVAGIIDKDEREYKSTVIRLLSEMRRAGELPFSWIADNTRWMRKPWTYSSLESALQRTAEAYRRSLWDNQPIYVEVWLEKDALAGVLLGETETYDVHLMVTRGYASLSYLHAAAQVIAVCGKPAYLYYFGDYDPSGLDITRAVEDGIREFAPDADIHFERIAVTPQQIADLRLPTRPTKTTDSRSRGFVGESVEVDAIAPGVLRGLVRHCITRHIDGQALDALQVAEQSERDFLTRMVREIFA